MAKQPCLFISHGPPFIALKACPAHHFLRHLGGELPRPQAILAISAHWESVTPLLTCGPAPGILYDFGGPAALRSVTYDLPGSPALTEKVIRMLHDQGISARSVERGFDHGTWIPLRLSYPKADIPVVQLSIQTETDAAYHYRIGNVVAPLREAGVMILASGGAVHNLEEASDYPIDAAPPEYVRRFDIWLQTNAICGNSDVLLNYKEHAPCPERCHPYPAEHFLPFFVALGAARGSKARLLHNSYLLGTLSMAAYIWD